MYTWGKLVELYQLAGGASSNLQPRYNVCPTDAVDVVIKGDGKRKQPYYFTRRDGRVMTIAAVQDGWVDTASSQALRSCCMVITGANRFVSDIHDRMSVILEPKDFEMWERGDLKDAAALMKPAGEGLLQKWPVSKRVNSSRADGDDAKLIDKIELSSSLSDLAVCAVDIGYPC